MAEEKTSKPRKARTPEKKPAAGQKAGTAVIMNFRRGRHTQRTNQFLLGVDGVDSKAKASRYIGRRVVWTSPGAAKKRIYGKITKPHGNSGVLRARFSSGLPGTALGTKVDILD
jgi:large subunit ribosomal protein L35Ae